MSNEKTSNELSDADLDAVVGGGPKPKVMVCVTHRSTRRTYCGTDWFIPESGTGSSTVDAIKKGVEAVANALKGLM